MWVMWVVIPRYIRTTSVGNNNNNNNNNAVSCTTGRGAPMNFPDFQTRENRGKRDLGRTYIAYDKILIYANNSKSKQCS